MLINFVGYTTLILASINIILGIVILLKGFKKPNNRVYALSILSISAWMISIYFYNNPGDFDPKMLLKIVYLLSYGMILTQFVFAYYFPRKTKTNLLLFSPVVVLLGLAGLFELLIQDSVVLSVINYPEKYLSIAQMGSGYLIHMLPSIIGGIVISVFFYKKSQKLVGYEKAQSNFYLIAVLSMLTPIIILDYILPIANGDTQYYVFGPLAVFPFTISLTYSILQDRFLKISVLFSKIFRAFLEFIYFFFVFLFYYFLQYSEAVKWFGFYLGTGIYIVIVFLIYFFIFKKIVNFLLNLLQKSNEVKLAAEKSYVQIGNTELSVERLVVNLRRVIKTIFDIREIGIAVYDRTTFEMEYEYHPNFQNLSKEDLLSALKYWDDVGSGELVVSDEIKRVTILEDSNIPVRFFRIIHFMDIHKISILIPFNSKTKFNGIIFLGYTKDKYPLTTDDIVVLKRIVENFSVSFGRAILYKEVEDFSRTLENKVYKQTEELQQKIEELEDARRKERDMLDIMGHELRTPATIVKLNTDLLGKFVKNNPESFKKYIDRIKNSIENEIKLIDTLLSSAKLEGKKIELNRERLSLPEQIENVLHGYEYQIKQKGLRVMLDLDENTKDVYADKVRVVEIIDNLLSNSIKYTDTGSIIIKTESTDDYVKVSVIDSGKGIPEKEIPRLGTKFHRIENYITGGSNFNIVRPGGTGLGLYVVYALIEMMSGKIWVHSQVGKGTTFTFTLPVYKGQGSAIPAVDKKNLFEKYGLKR